MRIWKKIRMLRQRSRFEADLAEEVQIHRQMATDAVGRGDAPGRFGSEAYFLEESRAVWGFGWLESLGQDIRYAIRGFRKSPLFALTVVGTIGLALGLNTMVFTLFDAYVLRPIAVKDPYSLYETWWTARSFHPRLDLRAYQDLATHTGLFSDVAATDFVLAPMDGGFGIGQLVSGNYFRMLQPGAFAGRLIEPEDAAVPGAGAVMVLSYQTWRNRYGGALDVLGRKVLVRGQPFEVIGIASPKFSGVGEITWDYWIPLSMDARVNPGPDLFGPERPEKLRPLVRLKPGVSTATAKSALLAWARAETAGQARDKQPIGIEMLSRATAMALSPEAAAAATPVFVAFGLVLAVACANVSNMMLARALARQREIGIRISLGAGRARLVRQLLTESLLLAVPAAFAGLLISQATIRFAQWLMFATLPQAFSKFVRMPRLESDWRVFGFLLVAALGATLIFGLIPAIQTTRSSLVQANRGDFGNDHRPARMRNMLVAAQAMVCCLLLIYAVIMAGGAERSAHLDVGMRTQGIFDIQTSYKRAAMERLAALPGVEGMAVAWRAPLYGGLNHVGMIPSGKQHEVPGGFNVVSQEYFALLRIPIVAGRGFTVDEARSGAAVAVVSQSTARLFWPGRDALQESVTVVKRSGQGLDGLPAGVRVIGIARDSGLSAYETDPTCVYFPTSAARPGNEALLVGIRGSKEAGRRMLETAMDGIAPGAADQINPLDEVLETMIYPFRVAFWISGFLAGLALILTASGVYGVMSYVVSQRAKEIGIRMALGAGAGTVARMVVGQSIRMAGIGAAIGGALALGVAPVFAHQVEAIRPYDPAAYGLGLMLVLGASLVATILPSRRAVRIDPVVTLRCD